MGTLSKLRRLVLRDKVSIRQASRQLGISRNTATRWLQEPEMVEPRYPTRQPPPSAMKMHIAGLDPLKAVNGRISRFFRLFNSGSLGTVASMPRSFKQKARPDL